MTYIKTDYRMRESKKLIKACMGVKCKNCGKKVKDKIVQLDFQEKSQIIVQGLRCENCGMLYVISVTDNELRKDIIKAYDIKGEIEGYKAMRDHEYNDWLDRRGFIPNDIKRRWSKKIGGLIEKYNTLAKANKEKGKRLKTEYMQR